jgi:hypothetical protein
MKPNPIQSGVSPFQSMNRSNRISYCVYPCSMWLLSRFYEGMHVFARGRSQIPKAYQRPLLDPLRVDTLRASKCRVRPLRAKSSRASDWASPHRLSRREWKPSASGSAHGSRRTIVGWCATRTREACKLDSTGQSLMRSAMQQLQLSARAFHRVLKIVRTIADLARSDDIAPAHLAEAIHLRQAEKAGISQE